MPAIATLLLAGLAFRLIIAYVLFPGSGFSSDLSTFTAWSLTMAEHGPGGFYASTSFADYPPAYLYVLWLVGSAARAVEGLLGMPAGEVARALVKLPPMLADVGIGYALYRVARSWFRDRKDAAELGLVAAAVYLVNPVTWYDSAVWGQVDAVGALVLLLALALLAAGLSEGAVAATVVAGLVKPQFGIVLAPLIAVVLLRRHLVAPRSGPLPERVPRWLRGWLVEEQGPWRLVSSAAVGLVLLVILIVPFGLDLAGLLQRLADTAGGYPYLSVNAYNPWALVGAGGRESLAAGGGWSEDEVPFLGAIPGVVLGTLLLAVGFLYGLVGAARREGRGTLLIALIFLSLGFFVLPTRVHERYLFPVFALLPLLAVVDRRWWWATAVLAIGSFMNLHGVLTTPLYATPNIADFLLGPEFRSYPFVFLSVLGHVAVFAFVVWRWRRGDAALVERPAGLVAVDEGAVRVEEAVPGSAPGALRATDREVLGEPAARGAVGPSTASAWLAALRERIDLRPLRRDRSASLAREPLGRLDRLDLLLVVLIIVAALTSRVWRLEEPYEMHFDEVYHARTATEFLQDWRYGIPHGIYEYTHPHLAKYLIAAGLVVAGNDRVTGTSELGIPVRDAAIETRWSPTDRPGQRNGDRLYVATGSELRVYDLARRAMLAALPVPAERLLVDESGHRLFAVQADSRLVSLSTEALDLFSLGAQGGPPSLTTVSELPGPARDLALDSDGVTLFVLLEGGRLMAMDPQTGEVLAETEVAGGHSLAAIDPVEAVVADPAAIGDPAVAASQLAELLGEDADRLEETISGADESILIHAYPGSELREAVQKAIDEEGLAGVSIGERAAIAVSSDRGVTIRAADDLSALETIDLEEPGLGMAVVREGDPAPALYVASGERLERIAVRNDERPSNQGPVEMPGRIEDVAWNAASKLVHALGRSPDGTASTIYVVEANGRAVFADARLPFEPAAWALDIQPERPSSDRQEALTLAPEGQLATVDIGSHAFAWRLPGVIAGALTAGLLYLLTRLLFRRRLVAGLVAVMGLVDGMFFANARIAMNDSYVVLFILASVTLFAALWLGHIRRGLLQAASLGLLGVLLGFALSAKWVGAYAIGGLLVLFLIRSGLGRLFLLAGMVAMTAVLGYMAISAAPEVAQPRQNFLFLTLLVGLCVAVAAAIVLRPIRITISELRLGLGASLLAGIVLAAAGLLLRHRLPAEDLLSGQNLLVAGGLCLLFAAGGYGAAVLAARRGLGPLATRAASDERVLRPRWLDPGWRSGLPWLGALLCLTCLPLLVYVFHYVPWAQPWHADGPVLASGWPLVGTWPPGHAGQTFLDLQRSMYDYHNDLRATHAASSPWWAWPLDLKPVWFYSEGFADETTAYIYDAGNLVLFWLAIPAALWTAWKAWQRRSLPLTLVTVMLLSLWLPWARIDRATFQYHVFTSLPFAFIGLSYFLAELWHGPSRRTWLLARMAGAVALVAAPLMWLGRGVLCGLAGTNLVKEGSQACSGTITTPVASVTEGSLFVALSLILAVTAGLAWFVLTARDSRRFVVAAMGLGVLWFVAWYPNLAALPMPRVQASAFQVFLPTYNYDFQFAVNTDPPFPTAILSLESLALFVGVGMVVLAAMYAASAWRAALDDRAVEDSTGPSV